MICRSLQEIDVKYLGVECFSAFSYRPKIFHDTVRNREYSSLLYIINGEYLYRYEGGEFVAKPGTIVYLPRGGSYDYTILSIKGYVRQIELNLFYKDEFFTFSEHPVVVLEKVGQEIGGIFADIVALQSKNLSVAECLKNNASILLLLSAFSSNAASKSYSLQYEKIMPAIEYIKKHFNEKIHISDLENICYLSGSQIRRIFKQELNLTPVKYKNQLLLDVACKMLSYNNTISEVSDFLGFDDVYVFSHFFKDRMGTSPMNYIKRLERPKS